MVKVYSVILTNTHEGYFVNIPDLDIATQGIDIADAIYMARDAIGLWGLAEEDSGRIIPEPSSNLKPYKLVPHKEGDIVTLVDVDFSAFRKMEDNIQTAREN